jgi:hypothetical protein
MGCGGVGIGCGMAWGLERVWRDAGVGVEGVGVGCTSPGALRTAYPVGLCGRHVALHQLTRGPPGPVPLGGLPEHVQGQQLVLARVPKAHVPVDAHVTVAGLGRAAPGGVGSRVSQARGKGKGEKKKKKKGLVLCAQIKGVAV